MCRLRFRSGIESLLIPHVVEHVFYGSILARLAQFDGMASSTEELVDFRPLNSLDVGMQLLGDERGNALLVKIVEPCVVVAECAYGR